MADQTTLSYTPRFTGAEATTNKWIWIPMHDRSGNAFNELAGQLTNNGYGSPIWGSHSITLTGTADWTTNPGRFTADGAAYWAAAIANFWNTVDLTTLSATSGMLCVSFTLKAGENPAATQTILQAGRMNTGYGGFMIQITTARRIQLSWRDSDDTGNTVTAVTNASTEPTFGNGLERSYCCVLDCSTSPITTRHYVDATLEATVNLTTPLPVYDTTANAGILASSTGANVLGTGATTKPIIQNLLIVRFEDALSPANEASYVSQLAANKHLPPTLIWTA